MIWPNLISAAVTSLYISILGIFVDSQMIGVAAVETKVPSAGVLKKGMGIKKSWKKEDPYKKGEQNWNKKKWTKK